MGDYLETLKPEETKATGLVVPGGPAQPAEPPVDTPSPMLAAASDFKPKAIEPAPEATSPLDADSAEDFSPESFQAPSTMLTSAQMATRLARAEQPPDLETPKRSPAEERAEKMRGALRAVVDYDLSRDAATTLRDAARLNLSPEDLASAPDFIRKPFLTQDDLAKIAMRYPSTSAVLADPWIMAAFGNPKDVKALGEIEKEMGTLAQTKKRMGEAWDYKMLQEQHDYLGGLVAKFGALDPASVPGWEAERATLAKQMEAMPGQQAYQLPEEEKQQYAARMSRPLGLPANLNRAQYGPTPGQDIALAEMFNSLREGGVPEFMAKGTDVAAGMIDSLTRKETLVTAAGGAAVGASAAGVGALPGWGAGLLTGVTYVNYLKSAGRGHDVAREMGLTGWAADLVTEVYGVVGSVVDTVQTGIAAAPMKKAVEKEIAAAVKKGALEFLKRGAEETATEVAQDQMEMAAEDIGALVSNSFSGTNIDVHTLQERMDQALETTKFMLGGGFLVAGGGPIGSLSTEVARGLVEKAGQWVGKQAEAAKAQTANQAAEDLVKKVSEIAQNSEAMRQAPEAAGAIIERVAQDQGAPQSVFIAAQALETYRQEAFEQHGLDAEAFEDQFLTPMGLTMDQYQEAVDLDLSLELSLKGIPAVRETPIWQAIEKSEGVIRSEPKHLTDEKIEAAQALEGDPFAGIELQPDVTPETKRDLENQFVAAGQGRALAKAATEFLTRGISRIISPLMTDPNAWFRDNLTITNKRPGDGRTAGPAYHQPINAGVDLNQNVKLVFPKGYTKGEPAYKFSKGPKRQELRSAIVGNHSIPASGMDTSITASNADHLIGAAFKNHKNGTPKTEAEKIAILEAIAHIGEIAANSHLVETHADHKGQAGVKQIHRFFGGFFHDGKIFTARLLAKEMDGGGLEVDGIENVRLYDLQTVKEMSSANPTLDTSTSELLRRIQEGGLDLSGPSPDVFLSLRQLIENVKDSEGNSYLQSGDGKASRGLLETLMNGGFRMTLFEGRADASTPIHESAHLFVQVFRQVLATPLDQVADIEAFNRLKADFETLAASAGQADPYGQWSTEAHEKVARSFEVYLMEGKAPTAGLRGMFEQMKDWLLDIYKSVKKLDVELTDEVRDVFDRLVTADDEIAFESLRLAEPEGLTSEIAAELAPARDAARVAQEEAIRKTRVAELNKLKRLWRKEADQEAANHPAQLMLDEIIQDGGISAESLDAGGYNADHVKALNRKRPGLVKTEGRVGYDEFAQKFGMDSDDFINALIEGPTKKDIKAKYMADQEAAHAEWLGVDAPITDEEVKLRVLELEAARLQTVKAETAQKVLRETRQALERPGGLTQYKRAILREVGLRPVSEADALNMRDLKLSLRAEARGAREAAHATAVAKNTEMRSKVKQVREKSKADRAAKVLEMTIRFQIKNQIRTERLKFEALAKRITHADPGKYYETRGLAPEYHSQLLQLLGQFGLGPGAPEGTPSLTAFIAEAEDRNETVRVAEWIKDGRLPTGPDGRLKQWRGLAYEQFRDLYDAAENLRHLGKARQQMVAGGRRWNIENLAQAINTQIRANNDVTGAKTHKEIIEGKFAGKGAFDQFAEGVDGLNANLIKVETIGRVLDGGQVDGLVNQAIYGQIQKGWHTATELTDLATSRMKEIVKSTIGEKALRKMRGEKVKVDGFPLIMVQEQLVSLVLNSGNEGNLNSLMSIVIDDKGSTLTMDHIEKARAALTDKEMAFVQAVWNFLDQEMYPRLNELENRRSGLPLEKVQALEFTTPHGTFRGGYYPLAFDKEISERAEANQERAANKDLMGGTFHRTSIKSAATNKRVGTKYENLVPLLNLSVLSKSLNDNIHDLGYSEAVRDVQKLIHHPAVKDAIVGALGRKYFDQIPLWLQEVAKPGSREKVGIQEVNRGLRKLRNNISLATLGFKMAVVFCQVSGFTQSIQLLGTKHFLAGVKAHMADIPKSWKFIRESSTAMRDRPSVLSDIQKTWEHLRSSSLELKNRNKTSYDRDIADATETKSSFYQSKKEGFNELAFAPIAITDQLLANCVWKGGYLRALEEGKTHDQAVYYADAIVRSTQPMGGVKDQSNVQRGGQLGDFGKLFTMYYTFFSGTHNLAWEQGKYSAHDWKSGEKGKAAGGAARAALLLWLIPAVFDQLIRGEAPEDEEEFEDWLVDVGKGVISYAASGVPLLRSVVNYKLGDSPRFSPTPVADAISIFADADKVLGSLEKTSGQNRLIKGIGYATGLPSGQVLVTKAGLEEWDDDESTIENLWHLLIRRPFEK